MSDGRVQFNVNKVKLFNLSHVDDDDAVCWADDDGVGEAWWWWRLREAIANERL